MEEGGGGNGAEHDACTFLRSLGYEMLRELMLGLGDGHLKVRVACKRSTGVLGQVLLGQHADVNTLLKSSAFDERWQTDIPTLTSMPSRLTAEPMHRDERAQLMARAAKDGFVDDYRGIRISSTGKRFLIEQAIIWNLVDEHGVHVGQAATFSDWKPLSTDAP